MVLTRAVSLTVQSIYATAWVQNANVSTKFFVWLSNDDLESSFHVIYGSRLISHSDWSGLAICTLLGQIAEDVMPCYVFHYGWVAILN